MSSLIREMSILRHLFHLYNSNTATLTFKEKANKVAETPNTSIILTQNLLVNLDAKHDSKASNYTSFNEWDL